MVCFLEGTRVCQMVEAREAGFIHYIDGLVCFLSTSM